MEIVSLYSFPFLLTLSFCKFSSNQINIWMTLKHVSSYCGNGVCLNWVRTGFFLPHRPSITIWKLWGHWEHETYTPLSGTRWTGSCPRLTLLWQRYSKIMLRYLEKLRSRWWCLLGYKGSLQLDVFPYVTEHLCLDMWYLNVFKLLMEDYTLPSFHFPPTQQKIDWKRSQWGYDEVLETLRRGLSVCPAASLPVSSCYHPSQAGIHVPQLSEESGTAFQI